MQLGDYHSGLSRIFGGKRWIVASDVLAGAAPLVAALGRLGAERCLCVATSRGVGELPDSDLAPDPIVVEVSAPDMMTGIRRSLDTLADLPKSARAKLDAFDPTHEARVIGTIFDDGRPVAGRRKYGARKAAWQALEDKTRIDAFWDTAGIERAPSEVVGASLAELEASLAELDSGEGCVLSGDDREGFNGGASYVRWVRDAGSLGPVAQFFEAHCAKVRVMPFLEGIPCSIHGFVFSDDTLVLRPCELLVLRRPGKAELHYARAASFWDPPPADREAMRQTARRAGDFLRQSVGYRGAFTVDGVLTRDGFRPTELNPRFGAALGILTTKLDLPLLLLNAAVVEGEPVDWHPRDLERLILEVADRYRAGGGMAMTPQPRHETLTAELSIHDGVFHVARPGEEVDAHATLGPTAMGSMARVELVPERTPPGPSVAPRIAAALRCLDVHWGLGIGPLEPARDVRRAPGG